MRRHAKNNLGMGEIAVPSIKERLKAKTGLALKAAGVVVFIAVIAISMFYILNKDRGTAPAASQMLTAPVQRGSIEQTVEGTGTLQPSERYILKTKTDGTVEKVFVNEGSQVKAGDSILQIKNEKVANQNRQASLQWELAQKELSELLTPDENWAEQKAAQLKVEQYTIALEEKQEQIDDLVLKAPYDGMILETKISLGDKVNAGQTAVKLATSGEIEVVAQIDQKDINSIAAGMEANVYVKGINKTLQGRVKEVAFVGDTNSGKFEVILELLEADETIREGMQTQNTIYLVKELDREILLYKQGPGFIRYAESDEIASKVSGTVTAIYYEEGAKVNKGEPLIKLSNPELERQLKETRLQLVNAEEQLRQIIAPDEDTIKAQELKVLQNYNSYLTAKEKLDSLYVISPIDGVVVSLAVSSGEELSSENLEQELVVISSFQQTKMEISVDELDINKLEMGQEATITVDALPGKQLKGRIIGMAYEGITTNDITKYNVTLAVDYTEGIKGGMSATATICLAQKEDVLLVPSESVTTENGRSIVQVMINGQPQTKVIETGLSNARWTEVTQGLTEGEQIVVVSTANNNSSVRMFGPGIGGAPVGGMGGGAAVRIERSGNQQRGGSQGR